MISAKSSLTALRFSHRCPFLIPSSIINKKSILCIYNSSTNPISRQLAPNYRRSFSFQKLLLQEQQHLHNSNYKYAALLILFSSTYFITADSICNCNKISSNSINGTRTLCEENANKNGSTSAGSRTSNDNNDNSFEKEYDPSWIRRKIASWKIRGLKTPRRIRKNDPDLILDKRSIKKRKNDEIKMMNLIQEGRQIAQDLQQRQQQQLKSKDSNDNSILEMQKKLKELNDEAIELAFGVDLKTRQEFSFKYGCTGYTDEVLDEIIRIANKRGIVEIGAGNGQWARAITDRYNSKFNDKQQDKKRHQKFDFVLAYDDMSNLPLDKKRFHKGTKVYKQYFFDNVQPIASSSSTTTPTSSSDNSDNDRFRILKDFKCRGRVLLLVYPPPNDDNTSKSSNMAFSAIQQYVSAGDINDTVIYVGEGRGGANADDTFFDYLESSNDTDEYYWVLIRILNVKPLGSKGYEKCYIFQRRKGKKQ